MEAAPDKWARCLDENIGPFAVVAGAKLSNKSDTLMQKIQRTEPNPSLFQIPSDYTILEREQPGGPLLRPYAAADSSPQ